MKKRRAGAAPRCLMASFVVLDVDGVLHPLSEKGLPVNATFEDLSKRADEELEDDGSCVFRSVAGEPQQHLHSVLAGAYSQL